MEDDILERHARLRRRTLEIRGETTVTADEFSKSSEHADWIKYGTVTRSEKWLPTCSGYSPILNPPLDYTNWMPWHYTQLWNHISEWYNEGINGLLINQSTQLG